MIESQDVHISVRGLTMAYGDFVIQRDLSFDIMRGETFVIMGGSGCGKSTLLRHLIGLNRPARGQVLINGRNIWETSEELHSKTIQRCGVMYQNGALWSSMTLAENIALPLQEYSDYSAAEIEEICAYKLSLVGLNGFDQYYPSEISGGMRKRAALARALALDPEILFIDEPSAGLDPISSRNLDRLLINLRESLGTTIVVVTHELASIFAIATNSVFLDGDSRTMLATGDPRQLLLNREYPVIREFLSRGELQQNLSLDIA